MDAYRAAIALEEAAPGSGGRAQASTHGGLADALLQAGRAGEAAPSARAAIALQPGYANAHATLEKYRPPPLQPAAAPRERPVHVLALSAPTEASLKELAASYIGYCAGGLNTEELERKMAAFFCV